MKQQHVTDLLIDLELKRAFDINRVCDGIDAKSEDVLWLERRIGRCDELNAREANNERRD